MSENGKETVASRKLAAAELRRARKAARDPRIRLLSDSSDEVPKGILKNSSQRIPTKRSVSECVDDLTQIMADLDLNIHDFHNRETGNFCPYYHRFNEEDEEEEDEEEDDDDDDDDDDNEDQHRDDDITEVNDDKRNDKNLKKRCDCNNVSGDSGFTYNEKPKKSVRFDERVYEQVFFASRLYDRRHAKYHFSSRHHPPTNQQNNKSKKGRKHSSKSESDDETTRSTTSLKSENSYGCKMTKSQRAKQSKKDKKKMRLNNKNKEDGTDTSSDDQGYCSSFHSFSD